jgi:hypothetical protein
MQGKTIYFLMTMMRSRFISSLKTINRIQSSQLSMLIENYRSSWPDQLYMINKKLTLNPKLSQHFDNVINNSISSSNSNSIDSVVSADNHNDNNNNSKTFLPKRTIDPDLLTFQFTTNFTRGTSFFYSHLDLHPGDYKVVLLVMMMMIMMPLMMMTSVMYSSVDDV